jgi:ABC-type Fe3+ transport system permease subunit
MEDSISRQSEEPTPNPRPAGRIPARLAVYARPAVIAGAAIAVVCIVLLVIVFFLDSFNAATYSMTGKSVQDATDEAREIRESYSGVRIGAIVVLVLSVLAAIAGGVILYLGRGAAQEGDEDNGEDVDFEDLAGQ